MCAGAGCFFFRLRFIWFFLLLLLLSPCVYSHWKAIAILFHFIFSFSGTQCASMYSFALLKLHFMPKYLCSAFTVGFFLTVVVVCAIQNMSWWYLSIAMNFSIECATFFIVFIKIECLFLSHAEAKPSTPHNHIASKIFLIFFPSIFVRLVLGKKPASFLYKWCVCIICTIKRREKKTENKS